MIFYFFDDLIDYLNNHIMLQSRKENNHQCYFWNENCALLVTKVVIFFGKKEKISKNMLSNLAVCYF